MQFNNLLKAIASTIKEKLPSVVTCEPHGGRFDVKELARISTAAPAVFTSCLGIADLQGDPGGEKDANLILAAYVVTKHGATPDRSVQALDLVEALTLLVDGQQWGLSDYVQEAEKLRADNLHAVAVAKVGVALWAVSWRQKVRLGEPRWDLIDGELSQVLASHSPDIGLEHEDDYEPVAEAQPETP